MKSESFCNERSFFPQDTNETRAVIIYLEIYFIIKLLF